MLRLGDRNRDRIKSAIAVLAIHGLLGWALLRGLGVELAQPLVDRLKLIDVGQEPPAPPATPAPPDSAQAAVAKPDKAEGAAAPTNIADTPTQVVAPPPEIRLPVPPLIAVAPLAGEGSAPAAGADLPGAGTGSGGRGSGVGSGERGSGTGGGGGGIGSRARLIRGSIGPDDYPRAALAVRAQGTVYIRFTVAPDGRVRDCAVSRSSGNRALDEATCRLIRRRFRYRPARNAQGRPIAELVRGEQGWALAPEPPPIDAETPLHEH